MSTQLLIMSSSLDFAKIKHLFSQQGQKASNTATGEVVDDMKNDDFRFNVYNQLSFNILEKVEFSNVIYFQPKLEDFSDYRLALEATISIPLSEKLFFTNSFSLAHDTHPATDIPNTTYQIKNSLKYEF